MIETREAQRMADEAGLDLVEIQPDVRPPVCKIMDYGKFKYELSKKEHKSRAASKSAEMKEVRLGRSMKIDDHDVEIRLQQARRFLIDGHKVQVVAQFRGREIAHKDLGMGKLREFCNALSDVSKVELEPRFFGKRVTLILAPDKVKIDALKRKEAKEKAASAGPAPTPAPPGQAQASGAPPAQP